MESLTITSTVPLYTGRQIPRLGFGVYRISNDDTKTSVLEALRAGYRHIDTAQLYENEQEVGEAVRESRIPRDQIYITTKMNSKGKDYSSAIKAIDDSLKRLSTSYIDLFLIHDGLGGAGARSAMWAALIDAKKAGKLRDIGVSNYNVQHLEELKASGKELPVINQLHPLNQQRPIVEWCEKHGIVVEAYCPLIRGQFDVPILQNLAKKHNKDPGQILVRWSLQKGFVPLPKSVRPERIRSNADVYNFQLSGEDMKQLDDLDKGTAGAISWNPINTD